MARENPHRADLGKEVKRLRARADLSPKQLEQRARLAKDKVTRVENGTRTLSDSDALAIGRALKLPAEELEALRDLAALSRKRQPNKLIADYAKTYISYEQAADRIDFYSDELHPGLVQDPVYATAMLSRTDPDTVAERVAARMDRQKILARENPPVVRLLLGEAGLHRQVGGAAGLRRQLEHLESLLDMSRIHLRIVPFSAGGHAALGSRFSVVRLPNGDARVYVESVFDAIYFHKPDDVAKHEALFEAQWSAAADERTSATILRKRIQQLA